MRARTPTAPGGPHPLGQGDRVEVVPGRVALDDEVGLDAEHLVEGRHGHRPVVRDRVHLRLEGAGPTRLSQAGLDAVKRPEQGQRRRARPDARGPAVRRLERLENLRIPLGQVGQHVTWTKDTRWWA
ncbi:MAG: hypothetical protein L0H79_08435 [Intrasporangium sp.]|nr:hypothetical protein [Intrasporangium sp.]